MSTIVIILLSNKPECKPFLTGNRGMWYKINEYANIYIYIYI